MLPPWCSLEWKPRRPHRDVNISRLAIQLSRQRRIAPMLVPSCLLLLKPGRQHGDVKFSQLAILTSRQRQIASTLVPSCSLIPNPGRQHGENLFPCSIYQHPNAAKSSSRSCHRAYLHGNEEYIMKKVNVLALLTKIPTLPNRPPAHTMMLVDIKVKRI